MNVWAIYFVLLLEGIALRLRLRIRPPEADLFKLYLAMHLARTNGLRLRS